MSIKAKAPESGHSRIREYVILALVAVLAATGVRYFLLQTFWIPSASMERTLLLDDRVIVNKISHRFTAPDRGEIVVFTPPADWHVKPGEKYIKRVIGTGGDHVVCCDAQDRVTVNGKALDEDYLYPGDKPSTVTFDVTVPADSIFVLGDHRGDSGDSRYHLDAANGSIAVNRVVGRAFVIFWPLNRARDLSVPKTFKDVPAPR